MKSLLFKEIIDKFYSNKKINILILFLLSLIAGLFEYAGLILIFKFILFLSNPTSSYSFGVASFFENNFNISNSNQISLVLGVSIAFIYILKNIYMLLFVRFNNNILQDLSINAIIKIIKDFLFQDYIKTLKYTNEYKISMAMKLTNVVWTYCQKYINLVVNIVIAFMLVGYLYIKFFIPAIVATLFIGILSLIEYKYLKMKSNFQNKYFSSSIDNMNSLLIRSINSIKEIKLNNKQEYYVDKIKDRYFKCSELNKDRMFCDVFHIYFTEISVMFAFTLVLIVLFYTTNFNNQLLITYISTICVIVLRLTPVINRAQSCLYTINSYKNITREVLDFINIFDKNFDYSVTKEKLKFEKNIKLKNVSFSYDDNIGLKDVNLEIKKGEFIGIVGKSGCYKTTLSLLISLLLKPDNGQILVDDNELTKNDIKKWQNNIALMSQDYNLLFDNINEIDIKYLKQLKLDDIGEEIKNFSYGQKQRIALANILSQNKDILILDEISSSSDVLVEDEINNILFDLKGKKTIISIAHRLQILKYCDKIIYMDGGRIIDIDTFKNLSSRYSEFKKIVELSNFEIN